MMKKVSILFLIIIILLQVDLHAQSISSNLQKKVEIEIDSIMRKLEVVGLSVVVVDKSEIVYKKSFGFKSLSADKNVALKNDDLFRIASVSKTFVATSIFQLIERGLLNLDDDVNPFLKFKLQHPKFKDIPITVKMLLSHRSSINDSQRYYSFDMIDPKKNKKYYLCYNDYAPGSDYQYCNYNYNILAAVIEGITGTRFDDYVEKNILDPLGLKASYNVNRLDSNLFVPSYRYNDEYKSYMPVADVFKPYTWHLSGKKYKSGIYTPLFSPTGGLKITAKGLAKYMIMHINGGILGKKQIISPKSEMLMRSGLIQKANYAFSFRKYTSLLPGHTMYGQTGGSLGVLSAMIFDPEERFGFVVITNGCKSVSIDGYEDLHKSVIRCLYKNIITKKN